MLFTLLLLLPTGALSLAAQSQPVATEEVTYHNGEIALAAVLLLPSGRGPHPAAVMIHGSGTSDRTNSWARMVAELVVARGYAVLLPDKRGSGA